MSAMVLHSGEYELVEEGPLTKDELRAARPPRLVPKLLLLCAALAIGGAVLLRDRVERLDVGRASFASLRGLASDLGPTAPPMAEATIDPPPPAEPFVPRAPVKAIAPVDPPRPAKAKPAPKRVVTSRPSPATPRSRPSAP